jgi:3-hydroxyisobutyrate dehydrogenase-like beta-hydroxyacid dehydrogenase
LILVENGSLPHTEDTAMTEGRIGFIGLGMMGTAMAARLQDAQQPLAVYNRTPEKATSLLARGAIWCSSPGDIASSCKIIISMVSTSEVLEELSLGPYGITQGAKPGFVHADCSTVSPAVVARLAAAYHAHGGSFLHVPVLGSVTQAAEGKLLLFAGGPEEAFRRIEKILQILGTHIWRFEEPSQASQAKLICNLFIAGMITTLAEGFVFAEKAGLSPQIILEILHHSALDAPMYQSKGASMLAGNFTPRFFLELMLKDINLMLEAARHLGVSLPSIEVSRQLYQKARNRGLGKEDYSALLKVLRNAGTDPP